MYSEEELVEVLRAGKSLIRFGDGEVNLMLGLRNHYQEFTPELRRRLREVVREYGVDSPYILAVPRALTERNDELKIKNRFHVWLPFKVIFHLERFPKNTPYADAHCFYYDGLAERVFTNVFKEKEVIFITNKNTIEKQRKNPEMPWRNIEFVQTPEENVFDSEGLITQALDSILKTKRKESIVLFFAVGPVGKHMMKNYAERGYQCIDVGRGMEVMFTNESIEKLI